MGEVKSTMADLPFEILKQVFTHVWNFSEAGWSNADLSHCQRTCRNWQQAAKEILYGSINIYYQEEANLLVGTLSSPEQGHLVKTIDLNSLLYPKSDPEVTLWDRHDLFTAFAESCPNVIKFRAYNPNSILYIRLLNAFYNNQLTKLEQIPEPDEPIDIEAYNYAALALRGTLTHLSVFDLTYQADELDEIDFKSCNAIVSKLKEFKRLTTLIIMHHTNQCIMGVDSMIQDCPSLNSLQVSLFLLPEQQTLHDNSSTCITVKPSPDIKSFKGCWAIMYTDNSLNYFIRKFPNLNKLHLYYRHKDPVSSHFSPNVLVDFFNYVSKISYVLLDLNYQMDIINTWIKFLEMTDYQGIVGFEYDRHRHYTNNQNLKFSRQNSTERLTTTITYSTDRTSADLLPHTKLIERIGNKLQQLSVLGMGSLQGYNIDDQNEYNMVNGYWLDHILKNCPSLKWLKISLPGHIILHGGAHQEARNESLKELEISNMHVVEGSDPIFTDLSARLPSLKYFKLYVNMRETRWIKYRETVIKMSFTSFDTLTWSREETGGKILGNNWKFHLKITTAEEQKVAFFVGNKFQISESSAKTYENSFEEPEDLSFDITCKKLKHFWIKYENVNRKYTINID